MLNAVATRKLTECLLLVSPPNDTDYQQCCDMRLAQVSNKAAKSEIIRKFLGRLVELMEKMCLLTSDVAADISFEVDILCMYHATLSGMTRCAA